MKRPPKRIRQMMMAPTDDGLQFDYERRLRNALLALDGLGPEWLSWAEDNLPPGLSTREKAELVERGARCLVARKYSILGRDFKRSVIFSGYQFNDHGNLKAYL